jgi:hypothetical protein
MDDYLKSKIEKIRSMGFYYTFDGYAVSDFLTQLDKVIQIKDLVFQEARLTILTTELRSSKPEDFLALLPAASLLNVSASAMEQGPFGNELWFEWILPASPNA